MSEEPEYAPITDLERERFGYLQRLLREETVDACALMRVRWRGEQHTVIVSVSPTGEGGQITVLPIALMVPEELVDDLDPGPEMQQVRP